MCSEVRLQLNDSSPEAEFWVKVIWKIWRLYLGCVTSLANLSSLAKLANFSHRVSGKDE